ncbi:hypothetical protein [Desulfogranum marinum]|uniref:hypothetical protein n=1 Tax=Desulfogranum marinum TaxID=453220 RepID=UPI001964D7F7|nr:hypothetical protein [Desulfogranum marinum]MBM9514883.1 hypothetical protein [Desulfogranum marinum]
MRKLFYGVCIMTAASLMGCSGKTTDPREGGLFSYNPEAYEKRLQDRQNQLTQIEGTTRSEQNKKIELESSKKIQIQQKEYLEAQLSALSTSIEKLDKKITSTKTEIIAKKLERDKIIKEINEVKASHKLADAIDNEEEKQLEIERLTKRMNELEKEVEALMIL